MAQLEILIEQVRAILIQTEDSKSKYEIYNQFINECKLNNLSEDDFYKKVLKVAHKSIDWGYIEQEKKKKEKERLEKEERDKNSEKELEEIKKQIQYAPQFIDRLIKTAFDDDVVESAELISIFDKAERLSQDTYVLSGKISQLLDDQKYMAYPKADLSLPSLRETLCSTNWHSPERYRKITAPPPKRFPFEIVAVGVLLLCVAIGSVGYIFYLKPKWRDDEAVKRNGYYYTAADPNIALRLSKAEKVDYNFLKPLKYGTHLIVYETEPQWLNVKAGDAEGFVAARYTLNKQDFYLLNSIFGDAESKTVIESMKCRRAILQYYKQHGYIGQMDNSLQTELYGSPQANKEVWQVFSKAKSIKPNTSFFPKVVNPNSKYTDFAVLIKNAATGERKFLLFAFADDETPTFINEQPAPAEGDIVDVKAQNKGGQVVYMVKYSTGQRTFSAYVVNKVFLQRPFAKKQLAG